MFLYNKFVPSLSLFDEGAGAGVTGSVADSADGVSVENIVYGKRDDSEVHADASVDSANSDRSSVAEGENKAGGDADFESLIKGEFKDAFNKRVKSIIDRRVRDRDGLAAYKRETAELIELLAARYGADSSDISAITKAMREDDALFEEAADREGLTVEQYKYRLHLERENARLAAMEESFKNERAAKERLATWERDAGEVAKLYPGFNLNREAENPNFVKLLQSGIDVRTAYEVIHNEEIMSGAIRLTADTVSKNITDNIRARGLRPAENGASLKAATVFKSDPSKFTRQDRAEIVRRARRGETIKL